MKKILSLIFIVGLGILLAACSGNESETDKESAGNSEEKQVIKVGTNASHLGTIEMAVEGFNENNDKYVAEIVMFDDITTPNIALDEGKVDLNFYQHRPYLEGFNEKHNTNLVPVKDKGVYSIQYGIYSNKIDSLDELKEGDTIAISMDAVNRGISLKLLQEQGLVKLKEGVESPGLPDVIENPLNLNIIEVEITAIPNTLDDGKVTASVLMGFGMARSGRDATSAMAYSSDELTREMVECLVVKEENKDEDWALAFFDELTTERMADFYEETYQGTVHILE